MTMTNDDSDDPFGLARFTAAQDRGGTYQRAVAELRAGAKVSHWMWFVFPQIAGLGMSAVSREFAVSGLGEARAYLAHPVLGPRLRECAAIVAGTEGRSAERIFGPVDAVKLRSSMTLFAAAADEAGGLVFRAVLAKYFGGVPDEATVTRLLRSVVMRMAQLTRALLVGAMITVLAVLVPAGTPRAAAAAGHAPVRQLAAVRQLITVTASSRSTTFATFRAYRVTGTKRVLVYGPWTARVGYNGIAAPGGKREGDGRTPAGTYGFSFFFGVDPNPGVAFPYRHAYTYDYWDDDSASPRYNEWVDADAVSTGRDPEPMHNVPAYDYAAVIAYNTARTPGRGSAIFLHAGTGGATAGCVSLPVSELLKVLRWLTPTQHPVIAIGVS
jgi:uncharacterized protein (DUF1810 family)/L,D-peptidoglycan transpeptidase YkuD (ErfK/YbiS/YcfS/YnhG family)